jgi:asparagine synthase (glutamine-hydrolysing)
MCGIAGIVEYGGRKAPDIDFLGNMLLSLHHRGPDDGGMLLSGNAAIGMRRLSIIDLAGGKQPIWNENGTVAIVCNGEIYNYRELQERLRSKGHILTTSSDIEVILHLYEDLGEGCVKELRGMFAFAIWDSGSQRLFIARDRLGIKPLYYKDDGRSLIFASEIKAILRHPEVHPCLDMEALGHFLSLKYVPAPATMFSGIRALPPAHTLTCDRMGVKLRQYWTLSFDHSPRNYQDEETCAEELEALLRESVRLHLVSDVPFGAFLSGGVDSSLIVALMSQTMGSPVKTFSVGFEGAECQAFSELPYARLVSERFGTEHHEICLRPEDLTNLAEKVVRHLDQPIADNACIANYMVSKLAAEHVKMVLTGEGGDELFAGYARYSGERLAPVLRRVPKPAKALALELLHRLPGLRRPKLAMLALCEPEEARRMASWFPLFNRTMKSSLLTASSLHALADPYSEDIFRRHLAQTDATHWLSRMLYVDTKLWLADDLLARGDKTSMAASIEARVPLLDHKLVEFAASLPPNMKIRGLTRKYLLKKVARKWLPPEVIDRKKEGFPIPFSVWFRKECRPFLHDALSIGTVKRRGLFDPDYVQKLLVEHDSGAADHGQILWGLLSVELWHRSFLDSSQRIPAGHDQALATPAGTA